jgi:hypothetical protein
VIPADALQLAASVGFLILGIRLILRAGSGDEGPQSADPSPQPVFTVGEGPEGPGPTAP